MHWSDAMALPAPLNNNGLEPIQLPDLRRPERMPSLPAWVASRVASLRKECQPDPTTGKYREALTLPAHQTLSAIERETIDGHIVALEGCRRPTPVDDPATEEAVLVVVTKLVLALPAAKQNEASVEARGEAYMAALDDLPLWSVAAAARRWYRGEAGDKYDYHWCPAPADLRAISLNELSRVCARSEQLRRLLGAEQLIEYSDEHRVRMGERLAGLFRNLKNPPVGQDGSGGTIDQSG
jgi:hypothetical protein